jgi:hypothetical protein
MTGRVRGVASAVLALGLAAGLLSACSKPSTGPGDLASGRERVVDLVEEAAAALPPGLAVTVTPPTETGEVTCRKKLLGYAVGSAGTHRAEVPLLVDTPAGTNPRAALTAIEQRWRDQGYDIDRSGLSSERYPKIRARIDGYEVVATADLQTPRLTFYAVSPCLTS